MRTLNKTPTPPILTINAARWRDEYQQAVNSGGRPPTPWRHTEIVKALSVETLSKCAYCEAIIADVSYPHIEHILPKIQRPDLVVEWTNLTLACPVCNTEKGDYYAADAPLLNPYSDPLDKHMAFHGPALFAVLDSDMGERTIVRLRLMRPALLMERLKRLQDVHERLRRWEQADGPDKEVLADLVRDALADDSEFVQCLRAYVSTTNFPL